MRWQYMHSRCIRCADDELLYRVECMSVLIYCININYRGRVHDGVAICVADFPPELLPCVHSEVVDGGSGQAKECRNKGYDEGRI